MKKYFLFILAFISSLFFLLQIPFTFQQTVLAATQTIKCYCNDTNPKPDPKNLYKGENGWHCDNGGMIAGGPTACVHNEEKCVNTPGAGIYSTTVTSGSGAGTRFGIGGPSTTYNYVGVSCQTISVCSCGKSPSGVSQIQCYTPVAGQPNKYVAGNQATQAHSFDCGQGTACEKQPGVDDPNQYYLNRQVPEVACVSQCSCDHPGKAGQGNNGYTCVGQDSCLDGSKCNKGKCKDGSSCDTNACPNLEDYCSNTPSGTTSVSCVNSSTCGCSKDKTQVVCHAGAGVQNQQGQPDQQSFPCGGGRVCVTGNQYSHDFANQQVKGADCQPVNPTPLPPPPSPPCKQWGSNGVCNTFGSTFGGFPTDPEGFIQNIFAVLLSISGGIALLLIMRAGYQLMTAQGNPEKLNNAREQLVAAIVGLIFLIFSFIFLQLIGYDILRIPGFKSSDAAPMGGATCLPGNCISASLCTTKNSNRCNSNEYSSS